MSKCFVYVASRASVPERPEMWRRLRENGMPITSTWIDEAGEGETHSLCDLWQRIRDEILASDGLILYAKAEDFPLKGALVEVGIAIGMRKPIAIVLDGFSPEGRNMRPIGSWIAHPLCELFPDVASAYESIAKRTRHLRPEELLHEQT